MNYRHAEIMAKEDLGGAGTKVINITLKDVVSRMTIVFQPVGGSTTILGHPILGISKVELIDGSDVLHNLTGKEGQALNIFDHKNPVTQEIDYRVGGTPLIYYDLDFGRYLWDEQLAFVPTNFKNPQLKITWDENAYDNSVNSHGFMVYGHVFDQKAVSPSGFLMAKEIKSFVGAAGGYEYTDLPTDYLLRKIVLQGELAGSGVRAVIEEIRLSEDNDKRIPIDGDIHDLRAFLDPLVPDAVDIVRGTIASSSTTQYCTPHNLAVVSPNTQVVDKAIRVGPCSGGRFTAKMQTTAGVVEFQIRGKNPHGCICIPFGDQDNPENWYDVEKLGNLKLRIKGGSGAASSTTRISTQQLRTY